eukprot:scaffold1314_cov386-Pavlova_lutheri.AAC.4
MQKEQTGTQAYGCILGGSGYSKMKTRRVHGIEWCCMQLPPGDASWEKATGWTFLPRSHTWQDPHGSW